MFGKRRKQKAAEPSGPGDAEGPGDDAPGWEAIDRAVDVLYPGVEPHHVAPVLGPQFSRDETLQGLSAYPASDHWHLITYGLSELYTKESDDPDRSGWGYELTIRVRPKTTEPPRWASTLLDQIAKATALEGLVFGVGHRLDAMKPIDGDRSPFGAVAFALDPQLQEIDTPNGRLQLLQLVGITLEELEEMKATSSKAVLDRLARVDPLLVTDPARLG